MDHLVLDCLHHLLAVFEHLFFARDFLCVGRAGWRLILWRAPGRGDFIRGDSTGIVSSREDCAAEYGPGDGGADEDERDGEDSFGHDSPIVPAGRGTGNVVSHRLSHGETR